ncbi:hypothetical protein VP06_28045 [Methylobacterium aquaticum]|uniref:Uncharacterized protein n=1 Tax=Methylobacterium aquaticum TaxID=270351 RepID=A0A0J6RZG4_9HYPH|nr:hypothetical protein VP06_28045 [Methylobacterium aquaticum]
MIAAARAARRSPTRVRLSGSSASASTSRAGPLAPSPRPASQRAIIRSASARCSPASNGPSSERPASASRTLSLDSVPPKPRTPPLWSDFASTQPAIAARRSGETGSAGGMADSVAAWDAGSFSLAPAGPAAGANACFSSGLSAGFGGVAGAACRGATEAVEAMLGLLVRAGRRPGLCRA